MLDDVVVPPDLPLEAIAEEVQNSWHLKVANSAVHTRLLQSYRVSFQHPFHCASGEGVRDLVQLLYMRTCVTCVPLGPWCKCSHTSVYSTTDGNTHQCTAIHATHTKECFSDVHSDVQVMWLPVHQSPPVCQWKHGSGARNIRVHYTRLSSLHSLCSMVGR